MRTNPHLAGRDAALAAFVDVETTGLSPARDEVVELAVALFWFERPTGRILEIADRYVGLREPSVPVPPDATRIHGLTMEDLRGHRLDEARIRQMLAQAEMIIAHNARFDFGFVTRLFPEAAAMPWYCSMSGIDWYGKGFRSRGLQQLLQSHRIRPRSAHRAGGDVDAAIALLSTPGADGQPYLKELLDRSRAINETGAR